MPSGLTNSLCKFGSVDPNPYRQGWAGDQETIVQTIIEPTWRRLLSDRTGATAIEYGLIAALIAIGIIAATQDMGNQFRVTMTGVKDKMAEGNGGA